MDEATNGAVKAQAPPTPLEAVEQLRSMFATLVPPQRVRVVDGFGGEHTLRGVLVAKAQVLVMQQLEALTDTRVPDVLSRDALAGGIGSIVSLLLKLAADPLVLQGLSNAFAVAHPGAVRVALENARRDGVALSDSAGPSDLFPVEEIVAGLVPFGIRLAKRALDTLEAVTASAAAASPEA